MLLGNAPTNIGEGNIEGLESTDTRGRFGGNDETHSCGSLSTRALSLRALGGHRQ